MDVSLFSISFSSLSHGFLLVNDSVELKATDKVVIRNGIAQICNVLECCCLGEGGSTLSSVECKLSTSITSYDEVQW